MGTGMRAYILRTDALGHDPIVTPPWIVGRDVMNAHLRWCPLSIEGIGHDLLPRLIPATVTNERDVEKSMLLEASGGILEDFAEHVFG